MIRTFEYIWTVSVCEPRPSATARTRVVSEIGSESENEPSAPVVTVRVDERRAVAVIATLTPARAGVTLPVSFARPLPVSLLRRLEIDRGRRHRPGRRSIPAAGPPQEPAT